MIIQGSKEWSELRKNKIGASDAPIIMGVSPWKTPFELFNDKLGLSNDQNLTAPMQRGIDLEPIARKKFENQTGIMVFPEVRIHSKYDWMMASLDGVDISGKTAVEIKCPGEIDHQLALQGKIPDKYIPQLQHQMYVLGIEVMYYFSYSNESSNLLQINIDDKYIDVLLYKEKEFYDRLQRLDPPELCERDYQIREDDEWKKLARQYTECQKLHSEIEKDMESIKKELIKISKGKNSKGSGITFSSCVKKGSIDYKKIPEIRDLNLEIYRKPPTQYYRISI